MADRITQVTPGGVFRATWVNSGQTPSPIVYNIFTGSETLASSYAGVSSGNGFFYADVAVNTAGVWKGSWFATISANSYRNDEWLTAFPSDTDQPGRYITWDDVVNRFTGFADVAGAVKAASHYVSYAEAFIDGRLAPKFVTPFSSNNVTVRDLAIDVVQMRALRAQNNDEYKNIRADVTSRIAALLAGDEIMITTSGALVTADVTLAGVAWSSTQAYHPTFSGVLPDELLVPSSAQLIAEGDERGYVNN